MFNHPGAILIWVAMWIFVTSIDVALARIPVCYGNHVDTLEQLVGDPCKVHDLRRCARNE